MSNDKSILEVYLSQPNTITLLWDKDDAWQVIKNNESTIQESYYVKNGIFGLFDLVSDADKTGYIKFSTGLKNRKLSREEVSYNNTVFLLKVTNDIEMYYRFHVYSNKEEMIIKIERLSMEDSYRHDLLQNLTNDFVASTNSFIKEANKLFKRYSNYNYAVIQFDIENFKIINSQYGENFGDDLLKFIQNTLKYLCNDYQLYTRISADVFMIVTPYTSTGYIIRFIDKLNNILSKYNDVDYKLVFGINYITDTSKHLRKYSDGAAIARKSIKKDALNYYAFYSDEMIEGAEDAAWIQMNMEHALKNHEFQMYLQPKYNISTHQIIGAEALVRWVHPVKGIIPPIKFISLFETNGFIKKLDRYMWEEACKCLKNWKDKGITLIPISVNVSRKHLLNNEYIDFLNELLVTYDIDKKFLELEITETLNEANVQAQLEILKRQGFTLLMDDFGSGYSSLNTLKDTVFDIVKLDREFLSNFISSSKGQKIVEHTINMTKDIGMDVVAEGVETEDQTEFLESCGCQFAQGFLYAKPMPLNEFNNLRKNS